MVRTVAVVWIVYHVWIWGANLVALAVARKIWQQSSSLRPTDFLIMMLSFSDFSGGFTNFAANIATSGDMSNTSLNGCKAQAFVTTFFSGFGLQIILLLGMVRYKIMTQSPGNRPFSLRQVQLFTVNCFLVSLAYPSVFVGADITVVQPSRLYCFHIIGRQNWATWLVNILAMVVSVIPTFSLLALYYRAYSRVCAIEGAIKDCSTVKNATASRAVAKMGMCVIALYFITVLPFFGTLVYLFTAPPDRVYTPLHDTFIAFSFDLSWAINPIIYFAFQKNYRKVLFDGIRSTTTFFSAINNKSTVTDSNDSSVKRFETASVGSKWSSTTAMQSTLSSGADCGANGNETVGHDRSPVACRSIEVMTMPSTESADDARIMPSSPSDASTREAQEC